MNRRFAMCVLSISMVSTTVHAGTITTDGTVGSHKTLSGPNFNIPQSLGTHAGNNLFHSFSKFTVDKGERATFTGDPTIQNVIARVTGGQVSTINGTFRSEVGKADVYFVNPAGIVFGQGAQIDVPAAFHASTADELKLADGSRFSATHPNVSHLSQATPAAFGFFATTHAHNGLIGIKGAQLAVTAGKQLDLVGRSITIKNQASIKSPAGDIRLVGVGPQQQRVPFTKDTTKPIKIPENRTDRRYTGTTTVANSAISTDGNGAGRIAIVGGQTLLNKAQISAMNTGEQDAESNRGIVLDNSVLTARGSSVLTDAHSSGHGANIRLKTSGNITLDHSEMSASTLGSGDAGNIRLQSGDIRISGRLHGTADRSAVSSQSRESSSGHPGLIQLVVGGPLDVLDNNYSLVFGMMFGTPALLQRDGTISTDSRSSFPAGSISITAQRVTLDGAGITSKALGIQSHGKGGTVSFHVDGALNVVNAGTVSTASAAGKAGNIVISAGSFLATSLFEAIDAGAYGPSVGLPGNAVRGGNIVINIAKDATIRSGAYISSNSSSKTGDAGNVTIHSKTLLINGDKEGDINCDSGISAIVEIGGNGKGGNVTVQADSLEMRNLSVIGGNPSGAGTAGDINITADKLRMIGDPLLGSPAIESNAFGLKAGNIIVSARGGIEMFGSLITATAANNGLGGTVIVRGGNIYLDNSGISADATTGTAGSVSVVSDNAFTLSNESAVSVNISTRNIAGNAGNVRVQSNILQLDHSLITSTVLPTSVTSHRQGNGGNILVKSELLTMNSASIQANTSVAGANAGIIDLTGVGVIVPSGNQLIVQDKTPLGYFSGNDNIVQATNPNGVPGTIRANTQQLNLSGVLANLRNPQFENRKVGEDYCTLGQTSTLTRHRNGGLLPKRESLRRL
jgi:filamentous hemagglutinin family protein